MKVKLIPMTEEQIATLPFPDTARAIGGVLVIEKDSLEHHLNLEEFRRQWNEMVSKEENFKTPIVEACGISEFALDYLKASSLDGLEDEE